MRAWVFWALSLDPGDLPEEPWALRVSPDVQIGKTFVRGGPYVTITDNESWLRGLQRELREGPEGPRARAGVLQEDLFALAALLERTTHHGEQDSRGPGAEPGGDRGA